MKLFKFFITCVLLFIVSPAWATWQDITFNSNATIQDGDQYVRVFANNNADVAVLGGQIGSLFCNNTSEITISGGTFRTSYFSYHPENNDGDDLDSIVIEEAGGMMLSGTTTATKPLALKFKPGKVPANIRALIIVPSRVMRWFTDYGVIEAVKDTFEARGVHCRYLKGSQASYEALAWYGANRNINYIYYCDHGQYIYKGVLRTRIGLSDGEAYSVKQSDFAPGQAPSWCEKLPGNLEKTAKSIYQIGFSQGELKFVHFDCCFTGRLKITGDNRLIEGPEGSQGLLSYYHNDMSLALNMQSSQTQLYQGWWGEVPKGETSKFNIFAYHEWNQLGEGDNLYDALTYAINHTDWEPDDPHDNFRLMGQGDITDLKIE